MSDCSKQAWRVPEQREPGVLYMHGHPGTDYAAVRAIEVDGRRFERADSKTRWHELFGTPEKVAELFTELTIHCIDCPLNEECEKTPDDVPCMLESKDFFIGWLNGVEVVSV